MYNKLEADVVIVGGGLAGLNAAIAAAEQGARVVVMERVNARNLETLPEPVDIVTIDVSFISLRLVLPAARGLFRRGAATEKFDSQNPLSIRDVGMDNRPGSCCAPTGFRFRINRCNSR